MVNFNLIDQYERPSVVNVGFEQVFTYRVRACTFLDPSSPKHFYLVNIFTVKKPMQQNPTISI